MFATPAEKCVLFFNPNLGAMRPIFLHNTMPLFIQGKFT